MDDAAALFHAWQRLRKNHNAGVDRRFIPRPNLPGRLCRGPRTDPAARAVRHLPGRLPGRGAAGCISGRVERNQPDRLPATHVAVGYLWVEERFRRLGIARALFAAIAEWASTQDGVAHFEMAVLGADAGAAAFWRSIGFAPFIERLCGAVERARPKRISLFLVRHGETAFDRDGQGLGREDVALTATGVAQAAAVGNRLAACAVRRVLSSPLSRARDVAGAIAVHHGLEVELLDALVELDIGQTEGLGFAEMRRRFPEFLAAWPDRTAGAPACPAAKASKTSRRGSPPVAELLLRDADGDTVVVAHNFVLRTLLCSLLGVETAAWRSFQVDLASVSCVNVRNGRVGVGFVNDRCHLVNLNLA